MNTRRWLVNALVTWHVSYKITTLVRILFSFLSKEALSFDSKWFLSITFNSKIFLFFCVCFFFLFELWILSMHRWISDPLWCLSLLKSSVGSVKCHTQCELLRQQLPFDTGNTVEWKYFWNSILHLLKMFWLSERTIFLQFLFANWKIHNPFFSSTIYK